MSEELWTASAIRPDRYSVSSHGRVQSRFRSGRTHILKNSVDSNGYERVCIKVNGHPRYIGVHLLVARSFLGEGAPGNYVRHIDGDQRNNNLANLAWGTPSENNQDTVRHGRHYNAVKTHCVNGHRLDEANTRIYMDGRRRVCRACVRDVQARARDRRKTVTR